MPRRWWRQIARSSPALAVLCIAAVAFSVRSLDLEHRPVHGDEANQAYKVGQLLETGRYVYDPHDHHGPTLYYLALVPLFLTGTNSLADIDTWMVRIVPVAFSAGTILLLLLVGRKLGYGGAICSALILLVSPAFTFYSRYFIQETLLVFFTFSAIVCGWRYLQRPGFGWAAATGISLSLMHATKETAILAYFAMAAAAVAVWIAARVRRVRPPLPEPDTAIRAAHFAAAIVSGACVSILLFSAFFTNARGPLDSILTYESYVRRAGGAGLHDKPWYYYVSLLAYTKRAPGPWWSEGLVLSLGLLGAIAAFVPLRVRDGADDFDPRLLRFLALFTLLLGATYSIVPYKTPWSMLSAYFGVVLLAGYAVARATSMAPGWRRGFVIAAFALVLAHLGLQSWRAETVYAADVRNPYVYAHTSTALVRLVDQIEDIAAVHPQGRALTIKVIQPDGDYWPLPWYLRRYSRVGYWQEVPDDPDGDIVIGDPRVAEDVAQRFTGEYFGPISGGLRPGVLRAVYVRAALWDAYMQSRGHDDATPQQ